MAKWELVKLIRTLTGDRKSLSVHVDNENPLEVQLKGTDFATQTTLAEILSKLSDPATQATLLDVLNKLDDLTAVKNLLTEGDAKVQLKGQIVAKSTDPKPPGQNGDILIWWDTKQVWLHDGTDWREW